MSLNALQRLRTYYNYPDLSKKSAAVLANNGFIYTGEGSTDKVSCVGCNLEKKDWEGNDSVEDIHKTISPNCPMLKEINKVNNIESQPIYQVCNAAFTKGINDSNEVSSSRSSPSMEPPVQIMTQIQSKGKYPCIKHNETFSKETNIVSSLPMSSDSLVGSFTQSIQNNATSSKKTNVSSPISSGALACSSIQTTQNNTSTNTQLQGQSLLTSKHLTVKSHQTNSVKPAPNPTYSELGIITEKPKHPEFSLKPTRLETFKTWPTDHHLRREDLAEAGFYYAGYGDCARCFFCGGGLRNWEKGDDAWVEHTRWFSKCAFIRQQMGQIFIDTVQDLNKTQEKISLLAVKDAIKAKSWSVYFETQRNPLKRDPAVRAMIENGYLESDVLEVAERIKKDNILSSDILYQQLKSDGQQASKPHTHQLSVTNRTDDQARINEIKKENIQLREQTLCKICMDSEVEVVFLPCGHLVSCKDCSVALKDCPVCRKQLKGMVRAFFG